MLRVHNVESFYGPVMAIKGVSLEVNEGEIVAILGANGAGKTTILKTISSVMDPEKGTIEFMDRKINLMDPDRVVRLGISHVPEGREVFEDLTVLENFITGAFVRRDRNAIARDLEIMYGYFPILKTRSAQLAGNLSGGEQQMLAIARGLMARPRLLLLDEPSLGLSPLLVTEIFHIIRQINAEQGTTMLLVEQNARMALNLADRGYVMELGRIVLEDTCKDLLNNEDVKEFYLGVKEQTIRGNKRWKRKKKWR